MNWKLKVNFILYQEKNLIKLVLVFTLDIKNLDSKYDYIKFFIFFIVNNSLLIKLIINMGLKGNISSKMSKI